MVPYTKELGDKMRHSLKQVGKKYIFSLRDLLPEDAGLYQLDVEGVNMFSTDFKSKFYISTHNKLVALTVFLKMIIHADVTTT